MRILDIIHSYSLSYRVFENISGYYRNNLIASQYAVVITWLPQFGIVAAAKPKCRSLFEYRNKFLHVSILHLAFDEEVEMVGHKTICPDVKISLFSCLV